MRTKFAFMFVFAALTLLTITGWGCGKGYGVSNFESDTSDTTASWQTYRNGEWGVSFTYPLDWQYREYREIVEGEEIVILAFSDYEFPETLPPSPSFPIMIFRENRTVENALSDYTEVVSIEDVTFGGRAIKKILYYSNILEQNDRVYIIPLRDGIIRLFVPDSTRYVPIAENMIATLAE